MIRKQLRYLSLRLRMRHIAAFFHVNIAWLRYGDTKYEPTLRDEVLKISEDIQEYIDRHPDELGKIKQVIEILTGRSEGRHEKSRQDQEMEEKTKYKKSA